MSTPTSARGYLIACQYPSRSDPERRVPPCQPMLTPINCAPSLLSLPRNFGARWLRSARRLVAADIATQAVDDQQAG